MGTRNLTFVSLGDEYVVAQYGQWDGYPDGQGRTILDFLRNELDRGLFIEKLCAITQATNEEYGSALEAFCGVGINEDGEFAGRISWEVSKAFHVKYPHWSRDTGGKILSIIQNSSQPISLFRQTDLAADSLLIEWAYVIDLDANTFEVYKGFNREPLNASNPHERFAQLPVVTNRYPVYYPVAHVATFPLDDLPDINDFLRATTPNDD